MLFGVFFVKKERKLIISFMLHLCEGNLKATNLIDCNFNLNRDLKKDTFSTGLTPHEGPFYTRSVYNII